MRVEAVAISHGLWARTSHRIKGCPWMADQMYVKHYKTEAHDWRHISKLKVRQSFFGVQLQEIIQS